MPALSVLWALLWALTELDIQFSEFVLMFVNDLTLSPPGSVMTKCEGPTRQI